MEDAVKIMLSKDQLDQAVVEYLQRRDMLPAKAKTVTVTVNAEVEGTDITSLSLEVEIKERRS